MQGHGERKQNAYTRQRKHVIYKFMSRLCILTSTESYLKLPLHVLSLFHAHIQTFFHSLLFFFFFFFVFKLSRAIDSMATRENSLELSQYRNNYSISIAKCFSMFCTNFCSLLFLCQYTAYIHWSSVKFWQRFDEGVRFSKRRFAGFVWRSTKKGSGRKVFLCHFRPRSKRETWTFYRKIHKGTRHDQTSF